MGQQVSTPQPHKKVKYSSSSSPSSIPKDITNHIATYLSKQDIASMHSTSTSQSKDVSQNIEYVGAKCATETVDGLTCNTERMPTSCVNWCKQNNAIRKFYSVFKILSQQGAIFKFDNQPADFPGAKVYGSELISLRLLDGSIHAIRRYNEETNFSETDTSYSYKTYSVIDGSTYYQPHAHPPEVICSKFEKLVAKPFSEWGGWELIIKANLHAPYERYIRGEHMNRNEIMSGTLYFKGKSIPCKGEVVDVSSRGLHTINIYIVS